MGKTVILGNASWGPHSSRISYDEGGGGSLGCLHSTSHYFLFCQKPIVNHLKMSSIKGGDTAGLSLLYTVTGQLKKLKKLARLLSIKGEASQEYRWGCLIAL